MKDFTHRKGELKLSHEKIRHQLKALFYTGGWKKFERFWTVIINAGGVKYMLPFLEMILSEVKKNHNKGAIGNPRDADLFKLQKIRIS